MKTIRLKSPRLRLDTNRYRELHRQVLERDGWRCQVCGSMQHLQVHHLAADLAPHFSKQEDFDSVTSTASTIKP